MHHARDLQQSGLFDPWAYLGEKRLHRLKRSWAEVFRTHLLGCLPVGKLAKHFSSGMSRPTKDLHVVCGALVLQQLHDLTDAAAVEALSFNIAWHYALDLRDESQAYLCEKTLRNYRRLVIDQGLDELLFQSLTDALIKAFDVETSKQRLDSTAIRSAMRTMTRLGTVVETIAKFLKELARVCPALHQRVDPELVCRYVDRIGDGCFANTTPGESKRRLPEAGADLLALSLMFEPTDAATLASFGILQRVLDEQFEVSRDDHDDDNGPLLRVKTPHEIPCDNARNPADPDSSYNKHRGQGYMAQVMETYQEDDACEEDTDVSAPIKPDLITHIAVGKMTAHDCNALEPALEDAKSRGHKPQRVLADTHYGSNKNVQQASGDGIELVSPAMTAKGTVRGDLTLEQFDLNQDGSVRRCPAGHAPQSTSINTAKLQVRFDPDLCAKCSMRDRCPTRTAHRRGEGRRLQYTPDRVRQRVRRLNDRSPAFKEKYRWRAGVEATMSRLKHPMGLARLRVRGMKAITYAVFMRALGLNMQRCSVCLAA